MTYTSGAITQALSHFANRRCGDVLMTFTPLSDWPIRTKIGRRYYLSLQEIIREINPILRGWRNFFKVGNNERHFYRLDRFVMNRLRIFGKRKHNDPCRGMRNVSVELFERLGLFRLARERVSFI
jgi:hypothetical protein